MMLGWLIKLSNRWIGHGSHSRQDGDIVTDVAFQPDYAIPPGITLMETLNSIGMSMEEFSVLSCISMNRLHLLFMGKVSMRPCEAQAIETSIGIPAAFWMERDRLYQIAINKE